MGEQDEPVDEPTPDVVQPRRRLLELDPEQNWYGTVFGISAGLLALWALAA